VNRPSVLVVAASAVALLPATARATYSIVATDRTTGEVGGAVTSCVGSQGVGAGDGGGGVAGSQAGAGAAGSGGGAGGTEPGDDSGGCSCHASGRGARSFGFVALAAGLPLLLRRTRRRRVRPRVRV
jgi:hypothetical protein